MRFNKIFIEITNFCGLNCSFCTPTKAKDIMPLSLFSRIAKEIAPYTHFCALHILGDPLSVESLKEYLDIAENFKLKIDLTTSGFYCNVENSNLLLHHPSIHQINISLTSALYQKESIALDSYLKAILELCTLHQKLKSEKFINLRLWNLNKDFSAPNKNTILYQRLKDFFHLDKIVPTKTRLAYKIHLVGAPFFEWVNPQKTKISNGFCYGASKQLGILCNGVVVPCCFDTKGAIPLGNLSTQNLKEILQTPRIESLIQGFKEGKRIESLCQSCSYLPQPASQ
ncbi:MAG: SPASM domain-containing protein [Helicobacter sp.]|uniref:radical SAM/SPASM domain-containing protein n=1 Tax=Helicobacter sp. TaxID=218 RepID=UPI0023BC358F|nr:radical SAM/SPASM domain-containing protein [Helicobacter sp.]MDE5925961.1 SPASM domain-containing protein [Helicobacter sp.]MDE7176091.1 SPASM domain-containing protein [Helicobacter sp.]